MNKRQRKKKYKKFIISLANDGREFKSKEARKLWISKTVNGWGTAFTRKYLYLK
ncbi:hypothetical protein LAV44_09165 [Clostridium sporogenes]|uniref:hypothetical protein n=1 Tax=Clostridium sporogenes TaxID=1509 RepID=UPI002237488E|nr:hypothetical protein [Clostridium sporogenes]MCW6075496.1 hypothetical protein [Clostridium sporogenes]